MSGARPTRFPSPVRAAFPPSQIPFSRFILLLSSPGITQTESRPALCPENRMSPPPLFLVRTPFPLVDEDCCVSFRKVEILPRFRGCRPLSLLHIRSLFLLQEASFPSHDTDLLFCISTRAFSRCDPKHSEGDTNQLSPGRTSKTWCHLPSPSLKESRVVPLLSDILFFSPVVLLSLP